MTDPNYKDLLIIFLLATIAITGIANLLSDVTITSRIILSLFPANLMGALDKDPADPEESDGFQPISTTTPPDAMATISGLSPASAIVGGRAFTLRVDGANFTNQSRIHWSSNPDATAGSSGYRATGFFEGVASPEGGFLIPPSLTTQITETDIANVGIRYVKVYSGGFLSASARFTIENPAPQITSLTVMGSNAQNSASNPARVVPENDNNNYSFTIVGSNFVNNTAVKFRENSTTTTTTNLTVANRTGTTRMTVTIPASLLRMAGDFPIEVINPAPGGGTATTTLYIR